MCYGFHVRSSPRAKMHLPLSVAIVILFASVRSNAAGDLTVIDAQADSPSSSNCKLSVAEKRKSFPVENLSTEDTTVEVSDSSHDADEKERGFELVMDRAGKFCTTHLTIMLESKNTFSTYPLLFFGLFAVFPYGKEQGIRLKVLKSLDIPKSDHQLFRLGFRALYERLNNFYMTNELSEGQRAVFEFYPSTFHKFAAFGFHGNSVLTSEDWYLLFNASPAKSGPFFRYNNALRTSDYMRMRQRCRYGKILGATFIELSPTGNYLQDEISVFIIRSDDKPGFRAMKNQLSTLNFTELRANSLDVDADILLPRFVMSKNFSTASLIADLLNSKNQSGSSTEDQESSTSTFLFNSTSLDRNYNLYFDMKYDQRWTMSGREEFGEAGASQSAESKGIFRFTVNRPFAAVVFKTFQLVTIVVC